MKKKEFLDLKQGSLSVIGYMHKFRALEKYCPSVFTAKAERASKFISGLVNELRPKVLSSRPQILDDVIELVSLLQ